MDAIARIESLYKKAGFDKVSIDGNVCVFKNKYSIHYIYYYESTIDAEVKWKFDHDGLISDYKAYEGPRDMEWNFYAIFCINSPVSDEFEVLRITIQTNTSFSRKFLYSTEELEELPPGAIPLHQTALSSIESTDLIGEWKKTLGTKLFEIIINGPKSGIGDRYSAYIEEIKREQ